MDERFATIVAYYMQGCIQVIYFMFFVRTPYIRWEFVVKNGFQVVLCVLFTYYVFARFCVPVFRNTGKDQGNLR